MKMVVIAHTWLGLFGVRQPQLSILGRHQRGAGVVDVINHDDTSSN